jgi:hypothetical protein
MPEAKALLLWLRHFLDAERYTRGYARSFVRYEQLLIDRPGAMAKVGRDLGLEWLTSSRDLSPQIEDFLSEEMRHHVSSSEELDTRLDIPQSLKDVFHWAEEASAGRLGPTSELDHFRDALRLTDMAFLPLLASTEASLAEQTQTAIMLDRQMARHSHAGAIQSDHYPEFAAGARDSQRIILDIVAHFGGANQALTYALNLASVARADLIWRFEVARSKAAELLAERDAYLRQLEECRAEAARLAKEAGDFQVLRANLNEAVVQRDAMRTLLRQQRAIAASWEARESSTRQRLQETVTDLDRKNSELERQLFALEQKRPELERDILFLKEKSSELEQQNQLFHARNVQIARLTRFVPAPLKYIVRHLIFRSRSAP